MIDLSHVRLYAHALTLASWAFLAWVFQLTGTTALIVLLLATLAASSAVAERERARRRRESRRT